MHIWPCFRSLLLDNLLILKLIFLKNSWWNLFRNWCHFFILPKNFNLMQKHFGCQACQPGGCNGGMWAEIWHDKVFYIQKYIKGLLHLLSRCTANPYGHNSWWKWSKLNTTVIYHNMKLMTTDWSTIDPQMTWKTTYSHRMTCITISPYNQ